MADVSSVLHFPLDAMLALLTIRPAAHNTRREEAEFLHCLVCKSLRATDGVLAPHHLEWNLGSVYPLSDRMKLLP